MVQIMAQTPSHLIGFLRNDVLTLNAMKTKNMMHGNQKHDA
jgi:hypothetical protein